MTANSVRAVAFSLNDFNWDACIKSGVVKVNVGANNAGFYQVYDLKINGDETLSFMFNLSCGMIPGF